MVKMASNRNKSQVPEELGAGRESYRPALVLLREFYIAFFGTLLPGLFTVVMMLATAGWAIMIANEVYSNCFYPCAGECPGLFENLGELHLEVSIFLLASSYLLGYIMFRRNTSLPDKASAKRQWDRSSKKEREAMAVRVQGEGESDLQFPYSHLKEYLEKRHLQHLAALIPWSGFDESTQDKRSKGFINILKIRLLSSAPDRCNEIIKSEAYVRLSTSVWYASGYLWITSFAGFVILVITGSALAIGSQMTQGTHFFELLPRSAVLSLALNVLLFFVSWHMRRTVEKFIHYLRVREVLFILESAYFAEKQGIDLYLKELVDTVKGKKAKPKRRKTKRATRATK